MVELFNRQSHADLHALEISWSLERDGVSVAEGMIRRPDIPPGERMVVNLYRDLAAFPGQGEGFLNFSVRVREAQPWAPEGFELSRLQFPVPKPSANRQVADVIFDHLPPVADSEDSSAPADDPVDNSPVGENRRPQPTETVWRYEALEGNLLLAGGGMGLKVRLSDAAIDLLDFGKGNVLAGPLEPDFYRAPTDNEKAGYAEFLKKPDSGSQKNHFPVSLAFRIAGIVYGRSWESAARNRRVKKWTVKDRGDILETSFRLSIPGFLGSFIQVYRLHSDGHLEILFVGRPRRRMVRFGSRMLIPGRYSQVRWFGRGPQACYADRKSGALVSLHESDVESLTHDYLKPQESGNRTDVRRVSFSDGGSALVFRSSGGSLMDFSASHASREAVERAGHPLRN